MIDLAGDWTLKASDGSHEVPMRLPGDAISALHAAGAIPDPYWGQNEYDLRWIADRDWVLSRRFPVEDTAQDLLIDGLDCVAEVAINGVAVHMSRNAFRRYRVDVSKALKAGENEIAITFLSNTMAANAAQAAQPWPVPSHPDNCPIPNGNMLRKAQCDFGWDWNIALAPFGLYGRVALARQADHRIDDVIVTQSHAAGRVTVQVEARFTAQATARGRVPYRIELCGQRVEVEACLVPGPGHARAEIGISDPDLWWPAGQGRQSLHELTVTLGDVSVTRRIGLRDVKLATGDGFAIHVNGRPIFCKGANWIPADALAGRITRAGVRDLLQSAIDANMNMIRVWGGGRYEPDWFYDLCDTMGVMVWQDFMFSCNLYPCDEAFLAEVRAEVSDTVARLNHHPCIMLWCGDNELVGALTWYPESRTDRDRYLVAYDRLNRDIETALKAVLPDANWWPSSPIPGPMNFGDAWHDDRQGDMHVWSVWHEGRDFEHYRDIRPRFCSEFGFQSYPSMEAIRRFAAPQDFNVAAPVMESHQKNAGGNARIAETMFRYFRFPERFEDFVYLSQVQQGLAVRTAVDAWRALKPHCMGTLYWQLNDTWPVCSWSSLDHGGGWKLLHHMARHFFAPMRVVAVPGDDDITLVAINDQPFVDSVSVEVVALSLDGSTRALATREERVPMEHSVTLLTLAADAIRPDELLFWRWKSEDGTGEEHFAPVPYKRLDLPDAGLTCGSERGEHGWTVTLNAGAVSLFASVESDQPGRFSDNACLIRPGRPLTLHFTPAQPGPPPRFRLRDLRSATYGDPP